MAESVLSECLCGLSRSVRSIGVGFVVGGDY